MEPTDAKQTEISPIEVDCRHLTCPLPVLRLTRALGACSAGDQVLLIATDPVSVLDIPHFCQDNGHRLVRHETASSDGDCIEHHFVVEKGCGDSN